MYTILKNLLAQVDTASFETRGWISLRKTKYGDDDDDDDAKKDVCRVKEGNYFW